MRWIGFWADKEKASAKARVLLIAEFRLILEGGNLAGRIKGKKAVALPTFHALPTTRQPHLQLSFVLNVNAFTYLTLIG